jgi:hypothetical protein
MVAGRGQKGVKTKYGGRMGYNRLVHSFKNGVFLLLRMFFL